MGVVSHGYGVLGGTGTEAVDRMHARQSQVGWSHGGRYRNTFPVLGDTLMTTSSRCAALGMVEPELVGLRGRPLHGTPRECSGSLSMLPVGYTPWCSMNEFCSALRVACSRKGLR